MADDQGADMTPMAMNAVVQHEIFLAWQAAGFSEQQAFELIKIAIFAAFGGHF